MSDLHKFVLYASHCPRNDFYLERIREGADRLGVSYTIEKVMDEAVIESAGIEITCLESYCPGCRAQHADAQPEDRFTPVLSVDDTLRFWNVPPSDEELNALIKLLTD